MRGKTRKNRAILITAALITVILATPSFSIVLRFVMRSESTEVSLVENREFG